MKRITALLLVMCSLLLLLPICGEAFQTDYKNITVSVGNQTLPLPEYPVGSKCLGTSDGMDYPLPEGGTVRVYGWQCYGFARYVFYRCFGVVDCTFAGGKGYHSVVSDVPASKITEQYLRGILGVSVLAGAHIRVGYDSSNGHSMVFLACDDKYVYTYEGNYDHKCGVTVNQRTWAEFVTFCKKKDRIEFIHMPDKYPSPPCPNCPGAGFSDMPAADNWAHKGMHFMLENGYFAGTSPNTVSPAVPMSRAMLVTVLWQMQGAPETDTVSEFSDVPTGEWYSTAVTWAAQTGLVSGVGEGCFAPEQTVTREQITVILHRYADYAQMSIAQADETQAVLEGYADGTTVSDWAAESMAWAIAGKLISGKLQDGQTVLAPASGASRAEVACILMNLCTVHP